MFRRHTKLRVKRKLRIHQKTISDVGEQASYTINRHLIRRWRNLNEVKRHVLAWWLLIVISSVGLFLQSGWLDSYYRKISYVPGGVYREGMLGDVTNINPIFASDEPDRAVSRLVFSGLLGFDNEGRLVNDLAQSVTADDKGTTYTAVLKPGIVWHDGSSLTADDVVYTIKMIQHPDTRSPLNLSWQGVTASVVDARTVKFELSSALTTFPQSLTVGIIPKHILAEQSPERLRSLPFNTTKAIGTGPFHVESIGLRDPSEVTNRRIILNANKRYYNGSPKLDQFVVDTYNDFDAIVADYRAGRLTGMVVTSAEQLQSIQGNKKISEREKVSTVPLFTGLYVFLKTSDPLFGDVKVRQALEQGTNPATMTAKFGEPVISVDSPILKGQVGYDKNITQSRYNPAHANQLLDDAGWKRNADGIRAKDGRLLDVNLTTQNDNDYPAIADDLKSQWAQLGVKVTVRSEPSDTIQQTIIAPHAYQALLYGISIGPDPDVYPYWHSKEASVNRFNLSEYKSPKADAALEAGRTRAVPAIRAVKYKPLLEAWRDDTPAIGLYQPLFIYVQAPNSFGLRTGHYVEAADRFSNVNEWMVKQKMIDQ